MRSRTTPPALFQALDNDDFKIFCEYQQSPLDFLITYQELTILEYAASQEKYGAVLEIVRIIEKFDYEGSKGFCKHFRLYETFDKLGAKGNPESLLAVVNLIIKKQVCDHNIIVTLDKYDRFKLLIDQKLWSIIKTIITPERLRSWEIASKPLSLPVFIEKNFPVEQKDKKNFQLPSLLHEDVIRAQSDELYGLSFKMLEGLITETLSDEEHKATEKVFNDYLEKSSWIPDANVNFMFGLFFAALKDSADDAKEICATLFPQLIKHHKYTARFFAEVLKSDNEFYLEGILKEGIENEGAYNLFRFMGAQGRNKRYESSKYEEKISDLFSVFISFFKNDVDVNALSNDFLLIMRNFLQMHADTLKRTGYYIFNDDGYESFEGNIFTRVWGEELCNRNQNNIAAVIVLFANFRFHFEGDEIKKKLISEILSILLQPKEFQKPSDYYHSLRNKKIAKEEIDSRVVMIYERDSSVEYDLIKGLQKLFQEVMSDAYCNETKLVSDLEILLTSDIFLKIIKGGSDSQANTLLEQCVDKKYWLLLEKIVRHSDYCIDASEETESSLKAAWLLQEAVKANQVSLVKALMQKHLALPSFLPFKETNAEGNNAFHLAILEGNKAMLEALLKNYSGLLQKNNAGETPIAMAVRLEKIELLKIISKHYPADKYPRLDYRKAVGEDDKKEIVKVVSLPAIPNSQNVNALHQRRRRPTVAVEDGVLPSITKRN